MSARRSLGRIFFFMLVLSSHFMAVTAGVIKGQIVDKKTREPLAGATLRVPGTSLGTLTDLNGNYKLSLKAGTYTLQVSYIGYKTEMIKGVSV